MSERFPENDALADLVAEARSVATPDVSVTAQDIRSAVQADQRKGYLRWGAALAVAAAAVLALSLFGGDSPSPAEKSTPVVSTAEEPKPEPDPRVDQPRSAPTTEPEPPSPEPKQPEPVLALAKGISVQTERGPEPVIVSQWQIDIAAGVYRIAVAPEVESTFHVAHRGRVLDVDPGTELVIDDGKVDVVHGRAHWQDVTKPDKPDASTLAARAENEMARGDRTAAIHTLTRLAKSHPRASETRTGLVDLARLRTAAGDRDHARCAYELVLKRWPNASIAPDIRRALGRLGEGPSCRGLRPN